MIIKENEYWFYKEKDLYKIKKINNITAILICINVITVKSNTIINYYPISMFNNNWRKAEKHEIPEPKELAIKEMVDTYKGELTKKDMEELTKLGTPKHLNEEYIFPIFKNTTNQHQSTKQLLKIKLN